VELKDGKTQLLQLNNPWGTGDFKGPFSDKSKEMTDAVAAELSHKKGADNGLFWITKQDFFSRYRSIEGVRLFDDTYKCVSTRSKIAPDNGKEEKVSFSIVPESQTTIVFVLAQRDRRRKSKGEGDEYPIGVGFRVHQTDKPEDVEKDEPKSEVILDVKPKFERSVVASLELDPGFGYYIVPYIEVAKDAKLKKPITEFQIYLRGYSKSTAVLEEMGYEEDEEEASDVDEEDDEEDGEGDK